MTPLLGITMKDSTSASANSSCPTPAWIGPPPLPISPLRVLFQRGAEGWKLAEGIPSHEAPALSITFQLANELDRRGGRRSERLQSQSKVEGGVR